MQTSAGNAAIDSSQPEVAPNARRSSRVSSAVQVVMITIFMLAIFFSYGWWRTGALASIWPWLIGQQLLFTPTQIELGNVSPNQVIEKQIRVINVSSKALSIVGSQKSCGCIGLDEFPIELAPGERHLLAIKIASGTKTGRFSHSIKFFCNGEHWSTVSVAVTGSVP